MVIQLQFGESNPANLAQHFLMRQAGVISAETWEKKGEILARVTVQEDSHLNGADLQQACVKALGAKKSPRMILLERIKQPVQERIA